MNQLVDRRTEVLIIGAGPTGLMIACQLAMYNIDFLIIDKHESRPESSGALIVQARTLEIFQQMGIAAEAINNGIIAKRISLVYNGKKNVSEIIQDFGGRLSQFPFLLLLEQSNTEKLLLRFLNAKGYSVERNLSFKNFVEHNNEVSTIVASADSTEQTIRSGFIIGADGADSNVRGFLKIPVIDKTYPHPFFILDCIAKTDLFPDEICFALTSSSVTGFFPLTGSRWRIDSTIPMELQKKKNITLDNLARYFPAWSGLNIRIQAYQWFSVSRSHHKNVCEMQKGNCFLTGDAAHVITPVGAQGMNTGLQDAYNLAWKLAFVIRHFAKPDLLDTYRKERTGIAENFSHYADKIFVVLTSDNPLIKFFRIYIFRFILMFLIERLANQKGFRLIFFKTISQIEIHYRKSIAYKATQGRFIKGIPNPGDRLPYAEFFLYGNKTDTHNILKVSCFNLIILSDNIPDEFGRISTQYQFSILHIPLLPETIKIYQILGVIKSGYYLVRPDCHIALRSSTLDSAILNNYVQQFLIRRDDNNSTQKTI